MTSLRLLDIPAAGLDARGLTPSAWFTSLRTYQVTEPLQLTTGDEETCVLILAGTFDLQGGGTVWQSRGARSTPFAGRPMAVFLPPRTPFAATGSGEILFLAARQPKGEAPATGREALSRKPLLPLAGSGKAFDPGSGEWKPAETFPTAPESLPPRRMQRDLVEGIAVERVFGVDYKAATLSVDEAVIPAGGRLPIHAIPGLPAARELLLLVRTEGSAAVAMDDREFTVTGQQAIWLPWTADARLTVSAGLGQSYVVLGFAGK